VTRSVKRGGIRIDQDVLGNLTIYPRGNGVAHVQHADIPDLISALHELRDAHALEDQTPTDNFKKELAEADTLVGDERDK
jgi:hypothetical protein